MTSHPNIAIISGEMSGDTVGGALARSINALAPNVSLWGMGSKRMETAGVEIVYDSSAWSSIGVVEALKIYPVLRFQILPGLLKLLEQRKPSAVVLIDFGAFNVRIAHWCKSKGIPVIYYFPPGSWKKSGRINPELARITDYIATPFAWSAERLANIGANVEFVGHPLLELVKPSLTRERFVERFGMDAALPIVGMLPGSRGFEVQHNTPAMLSAAALISQQVPESQFVFGLASESARDAVERCINTHPLSTGEETKTKPTKAFDRSDLKTQKQRSLITPEGITVHPDALTKKDEWLKRAQVKTGGHGLPSLVLAQNLTYDVMAHSDVLIICSGTATLEAAILGTPMVIIYRGSRLMEIEAKIRHVRPEHIGMPNIIAGERIMPEFIQHDASAENLANSALKFLRELDTRATAKRTLATVRDALGQPGASERTARKTLEIARISI